MSYEQNETKKLTDDSDNDGFTSDCIVTAAGIKNAVSRLKSEVNNFF